MDDTLDDLVRITRRCEQAGRALETEPLSSQIKQLHNFANQIGAGWPRSWLGNHSSIYIEGLRPLQSGECFDQEWGTYPTPINRTRGSWLIYYYEEVVDEI